MEPIRVLVTGTRENADYIKDLVFRVLDSYLLGRPPLTRLIIVHGQCPKGGVDLYAEQWAISRGHGYERHPADWAKWGNTAGPMRNTTMVNTRPNYCIGFPGSGSRGTWDCLAKAVSASIPTEVHTIGPWLLRDDN